MRPPGEGRSAVEYGTCEDHIDQEIEHYSHCPDPPGELGEDEIPYWFFFCCSLIELGQFDPADIQVVINLCESCVKRQQAYEEIKRDGWIDYDDSHDRKRKHPAAKLHRDAMIDIKRFSSALGLTVNARLQMPEDEEGEGDEEDGIGQYLSS